MQWVMTNKDILMMCHKSPEETPDSHRLLEAFVSLAAERINYIV